MNECRRREAELSTFTFWVSRNGRDGYMSLYISRVFVFVHINGLQRWSAVFGISGIAKCNFLILLLLQKRSRTTFRAVYKTLILTQLCQPFQALASHTEAIALRTDQSGQLAHGQLAVNERNVLLLRNNHVRTSTPFFKKALSQKARSRQHKYLLSALDSKTCSI